MKSKRILTALFVFLICISTLIMFSACKKTNKDPHDGSDSTSSQESSTDNDIKIPEIELDVNSPESVADAVNSLTEYGKKSIIASLGSQNGFDGSLTDILKHFSDAGLRMYDFKFKSASGDNTGVESVTYKNGTLLLVNGQSRLFMKLYQRGLLTVDTRDGIANVNLKPFNSGNTGDGGNKFNISLDGLDISDFSISAEAIEKFFSEIKISAGDLDESGKPGEYTVSDKYISSVIKAFGNLLKLDKEKLEDLGIGAEELASLKDIKLVLDLSEYDTEKKVVVKVKDKSDKQIILVGVSLADFVNGKGTGKILIDIDIEEAGTASVTIERSKQGELHFNLSFKPKEGKGELYIDVVKKQEPAETVAFEVRMNDGGKELINLRGTESYDKSQGKYSCDIEMELGDFSASGDNHSGVGLIAADNAEDKFTVKFNITAELSVPAEDSKIPELKSVSISAGLAGSEITANAEIKLLPGDLKKVGQTPLTGKITFKKPGESEQYLDLTVKTTDYSEKSQKYSASLKTRIIQDGKATDNNISFSLEFSKDIEIRLTELEEKYVKRADNLYADYDSVIARTTELNNKIIDYINKGSLTENSPLRYYTIDKDSELGYFTDITSDGRQLYVNTVCLLDYENYEYMYAKYDGSRKTLKWSYTGVYKDVLDTYNAIKKTYEGYAYDEYFCNPLYCKFIKQEGLYVVFAPNKLSTIQLYYEKPDDNMFPEYALHFVPDSINSISDIHVLGAAKFDDQCCEFLECKACGMVWTSLMPKHEKETNTLIGSPEHSINYYYFSRCKNCKRFSIVIDYGNSKTVTVELSAYDNIAKMLSFEAIYGENDNKVPIISLGTDNDKPLVITGFTASGFESNEKISIVIPELKISSEYRIIGIYIFNSYKKISNHVDMYLPDGLEFLDSDSLRNFNNVDSLYLPDSLRSIVSGAINSGISDLIIPSNVVYFGNYHVMPKLKKITVSSKLLKTFPYINAPQLEEIIIDHPLDTFYMFSSEKITEFTFRYPVKRILGGSIGNNVLERIIIPEGLVEIGDNAFKDFKALKEFTFPSTLKVIGERAFSNVQLKKIVLNSGLETIGLEAFSNNYALTEIIIPESVVFIDGYAFKGCGNLKKAQLPKALKSIPNGLFEFCNSLEEVNIPENLISIGSTAFYYCHKLVFNNLSFAEGLSEIGDHAFVGTTINNLYLPSTLEKIGSSAFYDLNIGNIYVAGTLNDSVSMALRHVGKIDEVTVAGDVLDTGIFYLNAETINIKSKTLPEKESITTVSEAIKTINFAGTKEAWEKAGLRILRGSDTVVNFGVNF